MEIENGTGQGTNSKIVYDCLDPSPYYNDSKEPYLDEADAIELPPDDNANPGDYRNKQYPYGPSNSNNFLGPVNQAGKKINRYYTKLKPYYVKEGENDQTLIFESRFESGNLRRVVMMGDHTYNLILKYDYQTTTYT